MSTVYAMNKRQSKLTSLWVDSDEDDCVILDPLPSSCTSVKSSNISLMKVNTPKKASQWVSSSFDGFGDFDPKESDLARCKSLPQKSRCSSSQAVKRPFPGSSRRETLVKNNTVSRRVTKLPDTNLWADKYSPFTQDELAVHKKKIADVEQWMKLHIERKGHVRPILLLTGPAGVGKTATVRVLARELGCQLHEWTNPLSESGDSRWSNEDWRARSRLDVPSSGSQVSQFQEFLLRANKYNTLNIFGGGQSAATNRKIIMVEDILLTHIMPNTTKVAYATSVDPDQTDFPNMFYRDPAPFHDILRRYAQTGGNPLIFIISDSTSGESGERLLFPKDIQAQLAIDSISFNPVAMTSMTKILTRIATDESLKGAHRFTIPSRNVLESIAMGSAGDIRGAINALQFACLKDTDDLAIGSLSKGKSKSRSGKKSSVADKKTAKLSKSISIQKDEELSAIGGRDTSIFLFRALGKILYCKRDLPAEDSGAVTLPAHLSHHLRDPLLVNPEDVVEKSHLSGDFFSAYLHQNYMDFFTSIEDVVMASEYLSDSDYLTIDWASRSALQHYAASVATRGIMHSNTGRARHNASGTSGLGWKPLHKPQWYTTSKMARQNCESARYLFRNCRVSPVILQTELIPYISIINTTLHDTGQISFLQEMCRFSNQRDRYEKLDEKDVDVDDTDVSGGQPAAGYVLSEDSSDVISSSQSKVPPAQEEEEQDEEFEIEDYDD